MRLIVGLAATLLLSATAAQASDPAKAPDSDKIVCKRVYDADTGSHFQSSKRVCRKTSEWAEIDSGNERFVRQVRESSGINPKDVSPTMGGTPR